MLLGVEIGGTKLQLGLGQGDGSPLVKLERRSVVPAGGAEGIRRQIEEVFGQLADRYAIDAVGFGFGGPVDSRRGRIIKSHQVAGWDDFDLVDWCRRCLGLPAVLANDSDSAGYAEARLGAGRGGRIVFYNNIGSGIGGALIIEGKLHTGSGGIAAEMGHLRPGPEAPSPEQTIESISSGWAIARAARQYVTEQPQAADAADLLARAGGSVDTLRTEHVAQAAQAGNALARGLFDRASRTLGWGLAQMITLVAPDVLVIGGGVSLVDTSLFLDPLRAAIERYVFPPLAGSYRVVRAELGEEVVVHGVLALAAEALATR